MSRSNLHSTPWLHMHGQFSYHGEATIVGSRDGLTALRAALDKALADGQGEASVFATDGEIYHVIVRRSRTIRDMGEPPYLDEIARNIACAERGFIAKMDKHNRSPHHPYPCAAPCCASASAFA